MDDDEPDTVETCPACWGSHGCDLPRGHDFPLHMCGFGDADGGPHSWHDGTRVWHAEFTTAGDDDPPTSLSKGYEGVELFEVGA